MTTNALAVWDFRMTKGELSAMDIMKSLEGIAKQFTFQLEESNNGYVHFQGRMSLIKRKRFSEKHILLNLLPIKFEYLMPTSNPETFKGDNFYVMKLETRIDGPYTDRDIPKETYIPRQYRGLLDNLRPFQQTIWDSVNVFEPRIINMIYCPHGNMGKSVIASLCELHAKGVDLPPCNEAEKLIQSMCDIVGPHGYKMRDPNPVFVDLPRAMNKDRLNGIYTAIEQIKKGKLFDTRYKYQQWWIDAPQIWVFSNIEPDLGMLSADRWKVWIINKEYHLEEYAVKNPTTFVAGFNPERI